MEHGLRRCKVSFSGSRNIKMILDFIKRSLECYKREYYMTIIQDKYGKTYLFLFSFFSFFHFFLSFFIFILYNLLLTIEHFSRRVYITTKYVTILNVFQDTL